MSPLRARMIEDMSLAGLAGGTQKIYAQAVTSVRRRPVFARAQGTPRFPFVVVAAGGLRFGPDDVASHLATALPDHDAAATPVRLRHSVRSHRRAHPVPSVKSP